MWTDLDQETVGVLDNEVSFIIEDNQSTIAIMFMEFEIQYKPTTEPLPDLVTKGLLPIL